MEAVDLEVKVAELTATLNQQSERMAQLLSQMEEMKLQAPQSHPPPPAFVPPPTAVDTDDWFNGIPPPIMDKKIQEKLDKVDRLENVLRKSRGVDDYMLDMEGLLEHAKIKLPENFKMPDIDRFDGTGNPKSYVKFCMNVL